MIFLIILEISEKCKKKNNFNLFKKNTHTNNIYKFSQILAKSPISLLARRERYFYMVLCLICFKLTINKKIMEWNLHYKLDLKFTH